MNPKARWFAAALAAGLALDQLTKMWARASLRGRPPVHVIGDNFLFHYTENPGMAFSMTGNRTFLIIAGFVILTILGFAFWRGDGNDRRLGFSLGLLAAGGAGNLIDRIFVGRVTDFVLWQAAGHAWPTFNVADALLAVGLAALLLVRAPRRTRAG